MPSFTDYLGDEQTAQQLFEARIGANLRVAMPGIIAAFDTETQTATVRPTIREKIMLPDNTEQWVELPLLPDVPVIMPRAGGFALTLPVAVGDECLVVFGDMCFDAWWQSGGVQNQADKRRHDLSDAFAILGPWSQPKRIPQFANDAAELRSLTSDAKVRVGKTAVTASVGNSELQITANQARLSIGAASITLGNNSIEMNAPSVRINGQAVGV